MSDPVTILHVCEHFGGREASLHGVARSFQWQLPLFDPARYRVLLCSRKGPDKAAQEMIAGGLTPYYLGYGKFDPRNLLALLRLIRRENARLLHAHGYGACLWARLAGRWLGLPVIVHGRCNYGTVPLFQRPVEWLLGPRTKYALAVSESTRQFLIHKRHIPAAAVQTLYNGILLDKIPRLDAAQRAALRARFDVPPETWLLGIVGRLESHKGHLDVFAALEIAANHPALRNRPWLLWVVGDGAYTPVLTEWARTHPQGQFIRFLGFQRDVLRLIQALDVQLFPSHFEGTPNTLFEALAVGNPVIASDSDGQAELLTHGQNALIYPCGNVPALANCLTRAAAHPEQMTALARQALERSRDFDGHRTIATLTDLYDHILNRHP
ncbi:MAG: glycosyltransferase family 4 protein [Candidatus Marinimicrobia bacterium]|nr:glycosyltransferase family 4 protein [Candidatus Neomarinimicrobiota bacterium]